MDIITKPCKINLTSVKDEALILQYLKLQKH